MNIVGRVGFPVVVCAAVFLSTPASLLAQAKPVGWTTTANLSTVASAGNTEAFSVGAKLRTERNWLRTMFFIDGSAIRQDASDRTVFAVGTPGSFTVTDTSTRHKKAENYNVDSGVERRITERFFWTLNGGYKRDLFSGIETLASGRAGLGYFWSNRSSQELKLAADVTYTHEKEQVKDPAKKDNFVGGRFQGDYSAKFGDTKQSSFTTKLAVDENFQVTDDWRLSSDNALTVSMSRRFALQLGARIDYRNMPALQEVDLFAAPPVPGGPSAIGKVTAPFKKTDATVTVSLVVNWGPQGPAGARPTP
jgi:putative salt-induced outer membrane protein YdiY